ncbi:neuronal acetylcholine receptor subunit beta-3-like [Acropora muricata]|uniref:neuronal acetylcholine receptor subunit beta-3-like n=1 Tax=Acropora muricata TaxID=159855 RepID=UPI0034E4DA26
MAQVLGGFILVFLLASGTELAVGGKKVNITQEPEYRLRQVLFSSHDRMVRPVSTASQAVNVTFQLDFKGLTGVDNKEQVITTDTVIKQVWYNPFLQWEASDYGGITQIFVEPKKVWVPDVVLENNADDLVVQAGHLEKFRTYVIVKNNGKNTWMSPATFKSSCQLDVQYFPFDKQKCNMSFRSLTSDRRMLDITTMEIKSDDPQKDLKLSSSNGYWTLRSIAIDNVQTQKEGQEFSEVVVSFFIGRRPLFFVLFSIVPCMIIGLLILVSFFIPAETGERIGLCATILLAVSVYLLVVTEQLPEQSVTLPLIGVYYTVIMFEIGLALAATVLVLKAHHATSEPPKCLIYLTKINDITCRKRFWRPKKTEAPAPATTDENSKQCYDEEAGQMEMKAPRISAAFSTNTVTLSEANQETWKEIARALDRVFFWVFLALIVLSSFVIYAHAGQLASNDNF